MPMVQRWWVVSHPPIFAKVGWWVTRDEYCAFTPQKWFLERGRARETSRRGGARQNRGLDLGRQTRACAPHRASVPAPPSPPNYVIMFRGAGCCYVAKHSFASN
ncbi:unnamed protein product [Diatraea saccharalis]|uniref:Uncharacterized protein n=1 Tax=Diatraea saccharalis TaxID=40085 RepID=A0A9N9R3D5_9NEOP|nr:unnamed protein product [Diatraea saccharalis]